MSSSGSSASLLSFPSALSLAQHDAPGLVITHQPAFAEGRLFHIGGEVTQGRAPAPRTLSLGHPGLLPDGGLDRAKMSG